MAATCKSNKQKAQNTPVSGLESAAKA